MGFLDQFSPMQRQALMIGVPAVAGFALISHLRSKGTVPAPTATTSVPTPTTDAIGVGQLSEFESLLTDQITGLAQMIAQQPAVPVVAVTTPPPAQPDTTQATPAPAPAQVSTPLDTRPPVPAGQQVAPGDQTYAYWSRIGFGSQDQYRTAYGIS